MVTCAGPVEDRAMGEEGECKVNPEYAEKRHRRKHALRRLLILAGSLLLLSLLLLGLIAFIVWLVLHPIHRPSWEVDDMKVITLNIQSTTTRRRLQETAQHHRDWGITTFLLNADMVVSLQAANRNHHMEITYDRIDMRVAYATAVFGRAVFEPFTQGKKNCSTVGAEVKAMSVPVTFIIANALQGEIQRGSVELQVFVNVRARVRIGNYRSFGFGLKTVCDVSTTTPVDGRNGQLITKKCRRS